MKQILFSLSVAGWALTLGPLWGAEPAPFIKAAFRDRPAPKLEAMASSMPIWFEPNRGQVGGRTEWTTRAAGAWLFLTSNEVVYALAPDTSGFDPAKTRGVPNFKTTNVHMRMVGGRRVKGGGEGALGSYSNYFVGKHEDEWFTGVPHFGRVRYSGVYPGIDVVYYATGRSVEYDFLVAPGADPSSIELAFDGVAGVRVDEGGDLVVSAGGKSFRQRRPRVFQGTEEIEASYRLTERGTVKVKVGEFDPSLSLRVDPVLDFCTYLGGPGEDGMADLAVAPDGTAVLAGFTQSPAAPTLDPFQQPSIVSLAPIVLKMSADGQRVIFYSILGSGGWDQPVAIALDSNGRIVVAGNTISATFPLRNAFQSEAKSIYNSGFITRLSADGRSLVHSSYIGGSIRDGLSSVAIDDQQNAYVSGGSNSKDFPLVQPVQSSSAGNTDAVLAKIGPDGRLLFSTYWGGPGAESFAGIVWRKDGMLFAIATSSGEELPLIDPIFTRPTTRIGYPNAALVAFDTKANVFRLSTYLGDGLAAAPTGIALDRDGRLFITGWASDRKLDLRNPLFGETIEGSTNSFLMSLRPDGKEILWSTVLPGLDAYNVAVDSAGWICVGGIANPGFPLKGAFQEFKGGGVLNSDHGIMKIAPGGSSLAYSIVIGGTGNEQGPRIVAGPAGTVFFAGVTLSRDYPVRAAYQPGIGGSFDGVFGRLTDNTIIQAPPFLVSPPSFSLRYVQGDPAPAPLRLAITNLTESVSVQSEVDWLRVSPANLSANGNIEILPEFGRLVQGTYRGVIRIGLATVEVSVTILDAAPLVTGVEPTIVSSGSGDTEITLRGSGFTNQTTVYVENVLWLLTPVRIVDSFTIRFKLPKSYFSGEYSFALSVQNPNSGRSKAVSLAVGRPAPAIAAGGIVSAASFAGQVISPGEIVTIFGERFETGMRVIFEGIPAEPFYLSAGQLSVTVPFGIVGAREADVLVEQSADRRSLPARMVVWPARPGLFTANSSGKGQGAILNQDGSVNSVSNPAAKGSIIVLYGTGGGPLAGKLLELPVKVFIDGIDCEVLYAGVAPGLVAGAIQVNVRVPAFAVNGEVVLRVGEQESQAGVTASLQ